MTFKRDMQKEEYYKRKIEKLEADLKTEKENLDNLKTKVSAILNYYAYNDSFALEIFKRDMQIALDPDYKRINTRVLGGDYIMIDIINWLDAEIKFIKERYPEKSNAVETARKIFDMEEALDLQKISKEEREYLERMLRGFVLSPIHKYDPWVEDKINDKISTIFYRGYPLIRKSENGVETYADPNRVNVMKITSKMDGAKMLEERRSPFMGVCRIIVDEMHPIKFPYMPSLTPDYTVYMMDFVTKDSKDADADLVAIFAVIDNKTGEAEKIYRYFKNSSKDGIYEISFQEFLATDLVEKTSGINRSIANKLCSIIFNNKGENGNESN